MVHWKSLACSSLKGTDSEGLEREIASIETRGQGTHRNAAHAEGTQQMDTDRPAQGPSKRFGVIVYPPTCVSTEAIFRDAMSLSLDAVQSNVQLEDATMAGRPSAPRSLANGGRGTNEATYSSTQNTSDHTLTPSRRLNSTTSTIPPQPTDGGMLTRGPHVLSSTLGAHPISDRRPSASTMQVGDGHITSVAPPSASFRPPSRDPSLINAVPVQEPIPRLQAEVGMAALAALNTTVQSPPQLEQPESQPLQQSSSGLPQLAIPVSGDDQVPSVRRGLIDLIKDWRVLSIVLVLVSIISGLAAGLSLGRNDNDSEIILADTRAPSGIPTMVPSLIPSSYPTKEPTLRDGTAKPTVAKVPPTLRPTSTGETYSPILAPTHQPVAIGTKPPSLPS